MASLDVLDYLTALDEALAREKLPSPLRKAALREARRTIDAMAFRFAVLDERPLPEDLDYLRAIEAMKPAERAAPVLARRRGTYAKARARRLGTTYIVLGVLVLLVGGFAWLVTSETSDDLASLSHRVAERSTYSENATFTVEPHMTRVYVAGTVFVGEDSRGTVDVFLLGPEGETRLFKTYADRGTYYLRENVYDAPPGRWRVMIDFNDAQGAIEVTVRGISPAR